MGSKETHYFIAKCSDFERLEQAYAKGEWGVSSHVKKAKEEQPKEILEAAFSSGNVIFLFSVNGSKKWQGYAQMTSLPVSTTQHVPGTSSDKIWFSFHVDWKFYSARIDDGLSFSKTESLTIRPTDANILEGTSTSGSINNARNFEKVAASVASELIHLMVAHDDALTKERAAKAEKAKLASIYIEDNPLTPENTWENILGRVSSFGHVLLACPSGSQRYNLSIETSDVDVFVVYQAPTQALLSLNPPPPTMKNNSDEKPDFTVLELQRYCELLKEGDPRTVESLFMNLDLCPSPPSPDWMKLRDMRRTFLTKIVVQKYLSDASGNNGLIRLKKQKTMTEVSKYKLLYIIFRLLFCAQQIIEHKDLTPYLDPSTPEYQKIKEIRSHKGDLEGLFLEATLMSEKLAASLASSSLPDTYDVTGGALSEWLVAVRLSQLLGKH